MAEVVGIFFIRDSKHKNSQIMIELPLESIKRKRTEEETEERVKAKTVHFSLLLNV